MSDDQIREIKRAAYDILKNVGVNIKHQSALDLLNEAGAAVKGENVKVPEHIIKDCIHTAPKGFTIYDRSGNRAMEVESRKSYYGTSCASPRTKDPFSGEIRETRVSDIVLGAKVADALPNIDWVMPMGSCQDVSPKVADLHEFEAVVTNTTKPIVFIGYTARGVELVYEMAAEVAGSMENLREKPFVLTYPEPVSPLIVPEEVIDKMFVAADLEMPQIPGPAVQPGATAPVTLAGALTQLIAEGLMCLVLIQLRKPGAPCFLGGNIAIFDMKTTLMGVGSPEMSLGMAAQAEIAQSFGLPTWGLAGSTDSKVLDAQAGVEGAFSILAQGLAGLNLIHDVGYMDMAMVCSTEMLVLGDEAIGMAKRFIRGIEVNSDTIAREVIENVGPGGNFLGEKHTRQHHRNELWRPNLMTRQGYIKWKKNGSKDINQRIRERIQDIVENHKVPPLSEDIIRNIKSIKQEGERELIGIQ